METRRAVLQGAGAAACFPVCSAWSQDALQEALARHAALVRTTDFADDEFGDLEALGAAIGQSRVVQLGEPSHGAGSAFAAKSRIVRFLHQRHGFDVLIWESGLYDVAVAQAAMRDPAISAVAAAHKGVFTLWSQAEEVRPLFEYVKASQSTLRPLDMAGFDMQVTADGTTARFASELGSFFRVLDDQSTRSQATELVDRVVSARQRLYATKFATAADLETLDAGVKAMRRLIADRRSEMAAAHGALETRFMDRCLENARFDAILRAEAARVPPTTTDRESRRDEWNAANLRWLLSERYAGRKAVVWAHNVHVMNAYYAPGFRDVHQERRGTDMKTTGCFMKYWLGRDVYTLGMTAYSGEEGFAMGGPRTPIAPAPDGSLEARLHALGHPFAFLDLRPLGRNRAFQNLQLRAPKFDINAVPDPSRIYDGVFFLDRVSAATKA